MATSSCPSSIEDSSKGQTKNGPLRFLKHVGATSIRAKADLGCHNNSQASKERTRAIESRESGKSICKSVEEQASNVRQGTEESSPAEKRQPQGTTTREGAVVMNANHQDDLNSNSKNNSDESMSDKVEVTRAEESPSDDPTTEESPSSLRAEPIKNPDNAGRPELQGVSVFHLKTVLLEQIVEGTPGLSKDSTIYELEDLRLETHGVIRRAGAQVLCPMTHKMGSAYVHSLHGQDHVGDANFMLSYTWKYTIGDIVATLEGFCQERGLDPKRTYFWICCLCNNQHRVFESALNGDFVPTSLFLEHFQVRVLGIGRLVCMMEPYDSPTYLKRVWCVFEIFTAIDNGCENHIVMPPQEKNRMLWDIIYQTNKEGEAEQSTGKLDVYTALSNTRVEHADASVAQDKTTILEILERVQGGAEVTNARVNKYLRHWFRTTILHHLRQEQAKVRKELEVDQTRDIVGIGILTQRVSEFFHQLSEDGIAVDLLKEAQEFFEKSASNRAGEHNESLAGVLNDLTTVLVERDYRDDSDGIKKKKDYEEALVYAERVVALCDEQSKGTAYIQLGRVYKKLEQYEQAMENLRKALEAEENFYGPESEDVAYVCNHLSSLHDKMGQKEQAVAYAKRRLDISLSSLGEHHQTISSYEFLGELVKGEEGLAYLDKALEMAKVVYGPRHKETASLYMVIGGIYADMKNYDEALKKLQIALELLKTSLGDEHRMTRMAKMKIRYCVAMRSLSTGWTDEDRHLMTGGNLDLPKTSADAAAAASDEAATTTTEAANSSDSGTASDEQVALGTENRGC